MSALVIRRLSRKLGEPPRRRIEGLRDFDRDLEPRELREIKLEKREESDEDEDLEKEDADDDLEDVEYAEEL